MGEPQLYHYPLSSQLNGPTTSLLTSGVLNYLANARNSLFLTARKSHSNNNSDFTPLSLGTFRRHISMRRQQGYFQPPPGTRYEHYLEESQLKFKPNEIQTQRKSNPTKFKPNEIQTKRNSSTCLLARRLC